MRHMEVNATDIALQFSRLNTTEVTGDKDNPLVLGILRAFNPWVQHDETAWCGAFVGMVCHLLQLPHPKGVDILRAREWLNVGIPIDIRKMEVGFDIVILKRSSNPAEAHVTFFYGFEPVDGLFMGLGGNQKNQVNQTRFRMDDILGARRLA